MSKMRNYLSVAVVGHLFALLQELDLEDAFPLIVQVLGDGWEILYFPVLLLLSIYVGAGNDATIESSVFQLQSRKRLIGYC